MKKNFFPVAMVVVLVLVACASPAADSVTQPSTSDQVGTVVAMTLQAPASEVTYTPTSAPEVSTSLLPRSLYFIGKDDQWISQIYRLERDGKTKIQLTFEPVNVTDYDVSLADGSIAYVASNQFLLVNADGSNRRIVIDGGTGPDLHGFYSPVFSPDGRTLAYGQDGLNLYDMSTGASRLVIENQLTEPQLLNGIEQSLPIEIYWPEKYSPDGTKLLVALGHWEVLPSHAVYYPERNELVRYEEAKEYLYCCSFHGGPEWSTDNSSFYGIASAHDYAFHQGALWKVDAANGAVTTIVPSREDTGMLSLPKEPYLAPDGQLYFFFGRYSENSGYFDAPVLQLVRTGHDGGTEVTVLRDENFRLMNEALWAPNASFVIVATLPERNWDQGGGVLELYYTDGQKEAIWLAPFGSQMKWGP
jgi:hypothetical protein